MQYVLNFVKPSRGLVCPCCVGMLLRSSMGPSMSILWRPTVSMSVSIL